MKIAKYTPDKIADWFLCSIDRSAGEAITHLKLQKMVYYAQAWSLALFNQPLLEEEIEAWAHGPVIPSLFNKYRGRGWENLEAPVKCPKFDKETDGLLKEVLEVYGKYDAKYLERLTHNEGIWNEVRAGLSPERASNRIISKKRMRSYYLKLYEEANEGQKKDTH